MYVDGGGGGGGDDPLRTRRPVLPSPLGDLFEAILTPYWYARRGQRIHSCVVVCVRGRVRVQDNTRAGVSVELNTCFLNAAAGSDTLDVQGKVIKYGRKLGFAEVQLTSRTTGKLVATGRHTKFFT